MMTSSLFGHVTAGAMAAGGQPLNAIVIGGTGATGVGLVGILLKSKDKVGKVTLLTRRKLENLPPQYEVDVAAEEGEGRLVQHVEGLDDVSDDTVKQLCTGAHVFFNCMGTTRSRAGSAAAFRHIDLEIPERLIRLSREAGVPHCSLLTSTGSNPNSWFLYLKTKGQMEDAVRSMKFPYTSIFRPGFLDRTTSEEERSSGSKFLGLFVRRMPVPTVGHAMFRDALAYHDKQQGEGQSEGATAAAQDVIIADNTAIYRLCQVLSFPPPGESLGLRLQ